MAQIPQHLIDEAAKRGIVPGARVRSAYSRLEVTVPPTEQWQLSVTGILTGQLPNGDGNRFLKSDGEWATVITPAPAKEEEGLKEGDA